jgi:aminoglycoside phosphotransferase (APT) family kinase protein
LWSFDDVKAVIDASVGFQSISISDASREALQNVQSIDANELCYLYVKLLEQCKVESDSLKKEDVAWVKLRINNKIEVGGVKVLVNNDFNLRNIAIRVGGEVAIYDWELAVFGLPLRVLVEFLSFVITDDWTDDQIHEMVSYHISELEGLQLVTFRMIGGKTS